MIVGVRSEKASPLGQTPRGWPSLPAQHLRHHRPYPSFFRVLSPPPTEYILLQSTTCFPNLPHLNCSGVAILAAFLHQCRTKPALWVCSLAFPAHSEDCEAMLANVTEFYGWYDAVPPEADDNEEAPAEAYNTFLQEPGVAERTDGEEDAPDEPPSDREDSTSSSRDEGSFFDCLEVGCTWLCAHHFHVDEDRDFHWYPDLAQCAPHGSNPKIRRIRSEMKVSMKDCQYCRIFFGIIGQTGCGRGCGANAQNDHTLESGGCHCKYAECRFRSNGQLEHVRMTWTCINHEGAYELGLLPGKVVWSLHDLHSNF